ncbi:MAG TPA: hypothetical protein DCZ92_07490 [Elusimicrobia bacterium]|nr:MAG: hypothetical protein A2016_10605 [Elusimicrobia bacterium GWF2_62_30]HBA60649.1 hypothetical protein [Elusimicrobiota bacterium]
MKTRKIRTAKTGTSLPAALLCVLLASSFCATRASAAFEDLGAGARGPGMGNAMVAVADDVYAAHYNPAGLGTLTRPQFTAAYTQYYAGLTDGSNLGTSLLGYAHPLGDGKRGTLAAAFNSFTLDGGLYRENTLYLSYGRLAYSRPGGDLYLGGTMKYLYSSFGNFAESANATNGVMTTNQSDPLLGGGSSHKAFDTDLGVLYSFLTHYQAGLQLTHVNRPNMAFGSGDSDRLPLGVKLGLNYKSLISNLVAQAETRSAPDGSADNRLTVAAERWFPKTFVGDFGVRGGIGVGSREYKNISAGLSYRNRRMQLDYGFSLPLGTIASTSGNHRMALTFHFGKPTDDEETLTMLMETLRGLRTGRMPASIVQKTTVTVFAAPELSETERAIAERLAAAEEAVKAGRYREAVNLASTVVELDPSIAAGWQNMGIGYLGLENYKSSLYAWNKAYECEKSPALKEAIKGYIKSISRLEQSGRAAKPQERPAAARRPSLSRAEIDMLLDAGVNYYVLKDAANARAAFEKVLQADPDNVEALKALRRLNEERGE